MKSKRTLALASGIAVLVGSFAVAQIILAASTSTLQSSVVVGPATPTVSSLNIAATPIILTANTTTPVTVTAIIADNNGCASLDNGTRTIKLYRTGAGAACAVNNLNCYVATAFNATSSCSGGTSENTTTTFNVYYFADSTSNASSSYPSDSWQALVSLTSAELTTTTANSATTSLSILNAMNVAESSITYGTLAASSTSATSQTTTISNAGNSSTTLVLSGTAFVSGANNFATTSQHYATSSSFTYGTSDNTLSDVPATFTNFVLTTPTTTTPVTNFVYWKVSVPSGKATGTYTATTTLTSLFHS